MMRRAMAGVMMAAALAATPALAHPHIWIDAGIEVIFDAQGRAEAVRLTWVYDDFYSLLLVEERGLDADHDGNATPEETVALQGFDMNWQAGFAGDSYVLSDEAPVVLGPPADWTAAYQGGRLTSTHLRRIDPPVAMDRPLKVQVYDPGFYSAYTIAYDPKFTPALPEGCAVEVFEPDRDAADERLLAALAEYGADEDVEADFPAVGAAFSEEVRITCGGA